MPLIVDGADQLKYNLPHFPPSKKGSSSGLAIPVHLMSVLNHGGNASGAGAFLFTSEKFCETGSNVTIEYLRQVIEHERARLHALGLLLPPRLHV
jgi:hypothetical protein